MVYVRDEDASRVVASDPKLREAVEGRAILLIVPGHGASVAVNMGLTLGWMGSSLAVYDMFQRKPQDAVYYLLSGAVAMGVMGVIACQMLGGTPDARSRMYRFGVSLVALGVVVLAVALFRGDRSAIVLGGVGVVTSVIASRMIAGANYALCAAFFRAKREYADAIAGEGGLKRGTDVRRRR